MARYVAEVMTPPAATQDKEKIAFVLPSLTGGGAQLVMLNLLAGLDRSVFLPNLITMDAKGQLTDLIVPGTACHDLGCSRLRLALVALIRLLRALRPKAIVSTLPHLNLAVLGSKSLISHSTKILVREANLPSKSLMTTSCPRLYRAGYRFLYGRADAVICPAAMLASELQTKFRVPIEKLYVLPNPVNVSLIREVAGSPQRVLGQGRRFVAAGRLVRQKGFDILLEMMAAMPGDTHLTIFGEGPERGRLTARAASLALGGRVDFVGFQANPWAWYAGADAFLLPSRWEGLPNAALEALACGTRVIATPQSGGFLEVASECPDGGAAIAEAGEPFIEAMRKISPSISSQPRASLLPRRFEADNVQARFHDLLLSSLT